MPTTFERPAPSIPDHRPSDEELRHIVYGADGEPDEITYPHQRGTFTTTRAERARAAQAWLDEGQVDYPENTPQPDRTARMMRFRARHMDEVEPPQTHALLKEYSDQLARVAIAAPRAGLPENEDWRSSETGQFNTPNTSEQPEPANYAGRHRRRGMRIPLHRLIRHSYTPRHASKR